MHKLAAIVTAVAVLAAPCAAAAKPVRAHDPIAHIALGVAHGHHHHHLSSRTFPR